MKKLRICILILVGALLLGLIGYHIPQKKQVSMWVCSLSGESAQIEMDLKYYRKLFSPPTVKGTVRFNGAEYLDQASTLKTLPGKNDNDSDGDRTFLNEENDFPDNMIFCKKSSEESVLDLWKEISMNQLHFLDISGGIDDLEKIHFMYRDISMQDEDGNIHAVSYFGPAQTAEEAQEIASHFGYQSGS